MPTISVIMPAYNCENFIKTAIGSVIAQTYTDFELIVIDDGSADSTAEIVKEISETDGRVVLLCNKSNLGVSASRNRGIDTARGEWIAFLDSDDIWEKDKLKKQIELLNGTPEAVIAYTASSYIDSEGKQYSFVLPAKPRTSYKDLLRHNLMSCSSVIVKRDVIAEIKMGGDSMHEDYSAWLLILKKYGYAYGINEPLLIYRLSENSKSSNRLYSAHMLYNSYRYVGYNAAVSAIMTLRYTFFSVWKRIKIKVS